MPDMLRSPTEQAEAKEAAERARWLAADVELNGPVTDRDSLCKQVDALSGCPVIDTVAAGFQMVADGRAAGLAQVMDFVTNDPGLCAQVLVAANRTGHDDMTAIEDARAGASLLGELKLNAIGKALPIVRERDMNLPPLTWPNFWMFQVAVGRVAQFICSYLELSYLSGNAYTAGLMHDIGKLFLLKLHPGGLEAVMRYAREKKVPVAVAEQKYLGCTTRDLALHFAQTRGLPAVYSDVIRWVEAPESAMENTDLVAIVALARHVCLHAHIGSCGDTGLHHHATIATTSAWSVLQPRLFPSFELKKFEAQANAFCLTLRQELIGQRPERRSSHAQRATELV
jgi:HD-like signal output (HDOD) protein